ncbi:hypothetical protein NI17_014780 [Thermobifida halotolerans]|uniref:Uncharacterized protein n=1 Tax=Thermobifida halotolerans TaxID=483545 RepID=A0AA97LU46_9ACTN|nr:hypothetical protein [Thermobifida halotolerans]UOE18109.1 hypothetical protein NI17_014780 [Thermobifida halotolerans]
MPSEPRPTRPEPPRAVAAAAGVAAVAVIAAGRTAGRVATGQPGVPAAGPGSEGAAAERVAGSGHPPAEDGGDGVGKYRDRRPTHPEGAVPAARPPQHPSPWSRPGAAPSTARRVGATALTAVGIAAVVLAVAGGWAAGRASAGLPVLPFTGAAEQSTSPDAEPDPTEAASSEAAPAEPAPAASASAEPEGQRVRFRNLTLTFPADWTVTTFEDVEFSNGSDPDQGSVTDDWMLAHPPGQPGCADWDRQTYWGGGEEIHCVHVKIFGPGGIRYGGEGWEPITEEPEWGAYVPRSGLGMCPPAAAPASVPADHHRPNVSELAPVGDRQALRREYGISCAAWGTGEPGVYEQRTWLLPESQILVVDEYGITELDAILADGEFAGAEDEKG